LKGPVIRGGDERIGRAALRRFHEMQTQARIALAFAGDRDAAAELVKQFDLDQAAAWARAHAERHYGVYPSWAPTVRLVPAALETSRPELAQKMRQRIIRLWQVEAKPTFPDHDAALLDKCSLTELKTIAESERSLRREAMRRWARLDPKGATPWLVERINDPSTGGQSMLRRRLRARADGRPARRGLAEGRLRQQHRPWGQSGGGASGIRRRQRCRVLPARRGT
jgi:hypothetical protein